MSIRKELERGGGSCDGGYGDCGDYGCCGGSGGSPSEGTDYSSKNGLHLMYYHAATRATMCAYSEWDQPMPALVGHFLIQLAHRIINFIVRR
jgi:hypothetical protein